jgi:hypothetical protein
MGPITLFDKSLIQSLSLDEAVWFDKFFTSVACPKTLSPKTSPRSSRVGLICFLVESKLLLRRAEQRNSCRFDTHATVLFRLR